MISRHGTRISALMLQRAAAVSMLSRNQAVASLSTTSRPERPRRSLFSVPGADERKLIKAQTLGADAVVLDLEDGVALDKKEEARQLVTQTLQDPSQDFGPSELCVRINALDTPLAQADLEAVLPCERLQSIVIPKVETAEDIHRVCEKMRKLCAHPDVIILAAIESALGVLNLKEIATANPRVDGLIFASEDYCAQVEAIRTPQAQELLVPRSLLVLTAKAYGLQAIDMVHIDFRNLDALQVECQTGKELGFTGKQAIHPAQVDIIQSTFLPSEKDLDFALRSIEAYESTTAQGQGACVVDGIVVDAPVYKWALKIKSRAQVAGMI